MATSKEPMSAPAQSAKGLGRNYWKLWSASVLSNLADGLSVVAIPWLASAVTRDPIQIALVTLATRAPWLLFALPAGVLTDRLDRRRAVALMDMLRFAVMLAFAFAVLATQADLPSAGEVETGVTAPDGHPFLLALLYVMAFLLGTAEVLRDNGAQTLLPSVVTPRQLAKANGRLWGAETIMGQLVGPPLAGFLLTAAFAAPLFVNAGAFAVAAAFVFALAGQFAPKGQTTAGRIAWRAEIGEGFRWLWRHPLLRPLAIVLGAANLTATMAEAVHVLFAQEVLGLDARGFGLLLTGAAAGGVLGAVVSDLVGARLPAGAVLAVSLTSMGIALAVIGASSSGVVVWAVFVMVGFMVIQWNVVTVSLRQTIVPDHLLGRVNSVYRFFGWGAISIGVLLGGAVVTVAETFLSRENALRAPYLVAAALHLLMLAYALPRLRTARVEEAKRQASNRAGSVDS